MLFMLLLVALVHLGPEHMADDGFHPGEPVYRACGEALAEFVAGRLTKHNEKETTP